MRKKYNKTKQSIKSEAEKAEAFKRAEEKIADLQLNDIHLKHVMSGGKNGVYYGNVPFVVDNPEAIWEMMENEVSTDKILSQIYDNRGKMNPSKYLKNKNGIKN